MQTQENTIDCYNKTAQAYADKFGDELDHKHLDRILLSAFAAENGAKGKMIDLGCGPGQTTNWVAKQGADVIGTDIAPAMVDVAEVLHPQLHFDTADMLQLPYPDKSFGSAIAFYSIVHFDYEHIRIAFNEIKRVLSANGQFLFSFHIGDQVVHMDEFLEQRVNIDFHFFEVEKVIEILSATGFEIIDSIERQPYPGFEYPSKRAYIWAAIV
ncbi:MAG: class I SAM-dependent methyltransferase [Chitinophagaceae bacterium]